MAKRLADTRPERGLLRLAVRLPIWLYRAYLGWLLGNRFLMLTHMGRKTGLPHQVVLEIVRYDKATDTYIIASGWGEKADWLRNIKQTPEVIVHTGLRRIEAMARRLSVEEAEQEMCDCARRHPMAFRLLARLLVGRRLSGTKEDFRLLSQLVPIVALQPKRPCCSAPEL